MDKTHYKSRVLRRIEDSGVFTRTKASSDGANSLYQVNDFLKGERIDLKNPGGRKTSVYANYDQETDFSVLYDRWDLAYRAAEGEDGADAGLLGQPDVDILNPGIPGAAFMMTSVFEKPEIPPIFYVLVASVLIDGISFLFVLCSLLLQYTARVFGGQFKVLKEKFGYKLFYLDWASWIFGLMMVATVVIMAVVSAGGDRAHLFSKNLAHRGYGRLIELDLSNDSDTKLAPNFKPLYSLGQDRGVKGTPAGDFYRWVIANQYAWEFTLTDGTLAEIARFEMLLNENFTQTWLGDPKVVSTLEAVFLKPTDEEVAQGDAFRWRFSPACYSTLTSYGKLKTTSLDLDKVKGDDSIVVNEECEADPTRSSMVFNARFGGRAFSSCSETLRTIYLYMRVKLGFLSWKRFGDMQAKGEHVGVDELGRFDITNMFRQELASECYFCVMERCWGHTATDLTLASKNSIIRTDEMFTTGAVSDNMIDHDCGVVSDVDSGARADQHIDPHCGESTLSWLGDSLLDEGNMEWVTNRVVPVVSKFCGLPLMTDAGCSTNGFSGRTVAGDVARDGHLGVKFKIYNYDADFRKFIASQILSSEDEELVMAIVSNLADLVTFPGAYAIQESRKDGYWLNLTSWSSFKEISWADAQYPDDFVGLNVTKLREQAVEWQRKSGVFDVLSMRLRGAFSSSWPFLRASVKAPKEAALQGLLLVPSDTAIQVCGNELSMFLSVKSGIFIDVLVTILDPVTLLLVHYISPSLALTGDPVAALSSLAIFLRPSHGVLDGALVGATKGALTGVFVGLLWLLWDSAGFIVSGRYFGERYAPVFFLITVASVAVFGAILGSLEGALNMGERKRGLTIAGCASRALTTALLLSTFWGLLAVLTAGSIWDQAHPYFNITRVEDAAAIAEYRAQYEKTAMEFDIPIAERDYSNNTYISAPPLEDGRVVCEMIAVYPGSFNTPGEFGFSQVCSHVGSISVAIFEDLSLMIPSLIEFQTKEGFLTMDNLTLPYWGRPTNPDFPFVIDRLIDRMWEQETRDTKVRWLMAETSLLPMEISAGQSFSHFMIGRSRRRAATTELIGVFFHFYNQTSVGLQLHAFFDEDTDCKLSSEMYMFDNTTETVDASEGRRISITCPVKESERVGTTPPLVLMISFDKPINHVKFGLYSGTFFTPVACPLRVKLDAGFKACPPKLLKEVEYTQWLELDNALPLGTGIAVFFCAVALCALVVVFCALIYGYGICGAERPRWMRYAMGIRRNERASKASARDRELREMSRSLGDKGGPSRKISRRKPSRRGSNRIEELPRPGSRIARHVPSGQTSTSGSVIVRGSARSSRSASNKGSRIGGRGRKISDPKSDMQSDGPVMVGGSPNYGSVPRYSQRPSQYSSSSAGLPQTQRTAYSYGHIPVGAQR